MKSPHPALEFPQETRLNEGLFTLTSYALIVLMMTCGAVTFGALVEHLVPSWTPPVLAALAFFIVFERLSTHARFRNLRALSPEWATALGIQWAVIGLLIRVVIGLSHGREIFLRDLPQLAQNPGAYFSTPEFLVALLISLIVWMLAGQFADLLDEMSYEQVKAELDAPVMSGGRPLPPPRARLMSLVFTIGSYLVIFTAMARVNTRVFVEGARESLFIKTGLFAGGGGATLLYFVLGLILLSQTQFASMHTQWRLRGSQVSRRLARSWTLYSIVFLAVVAGIVSLLPTNYSLGLLASLGYFLDLVTQTVIYIFQGLMSLIVLLIGLVYYLLMGRPQPLEPLATPVPTATPEPPIPLAAGDGVPWWEIMRAVLSWAVMLAILGFAIRQFARQHEGLLRELIKLPGGRWLLRAWHWLRGLFSSLSRESARALDAGRTLLRRIFPRERSSAPGGWLSLRRLDPRRRVYYFYLALIRRGAEHGLSRSASQTPYEYASTLEQALPDVDEDIQSLTGSFVEARYSLREVPPEEANLVRRTWEHIRRALRGVKRR